MVSVLCLDTEPETIDALLAGGHEVSSGELGYRKGLFRQPYPPHEFEAVVCDLKKPACFDSLDWGPGASNNNFQCKLVDQPTDQRIIQSGSSVPRYKLIQGQQIKEIGHSNFDGHAVLNAAVRAGTHVFLMLNSEWAKHISWSFPNFIGLSWALARTVANKVSLRTPLNSLLNDTERLSLRLPLQFSMTPATARQEAFKGLIASSPLATNAVDQMFGQLVTTPKGTLWILPAFEDSPKAILSALKNLHQIPKLIEMRGNAAPSKPHDAEAIRDVFISHASEDKDFARPLAEHLRSANISVWFDEYELKLGDSLRRRIDDGLKQSRHGLVIMSRHFFKKDWPQRELDALFSLETKDRRILPLWHGLTSSDVLKLAPLLADKLAISTDKGIPAITNEIKRVLGHI